ncbi:MAG: hypothetical protein QOF61_1663 [Acidobacteriota bacterium]|nr:hypothetical protein [Acidobacteriota bacterium]
MSTRVGELKTYAGFARRFGRRFLEERLAERHELIAPAPHKPDPASWSNERLTVAWLGHATVLMNFYGTWLLTDPALGRRVGVRLARGVTLGPRRLVEPALSVRELPQLDAVLVSHAHMDHCDLNTLRRLPRNTRAVVQRGNLDLVRRFRRSDELAWGQATEVSGARVESVEVNHWGARRLTDKGRGYGGFLIEKQGRAVVFGGDTAYTHAFARLRGRDAGVVLAILPIGAYNPYVYAHANPEQAWAMSREMGARYVLPMHHATFRLSREPVDEPIRRMIDAAGDQRWRVAVTEIGQTWSLPE